MWWETIELWYLAVIGVWDLRKKEIPLYVLAAGVLYAGGVGCWRCVSGALEPAEIVLGMLPGVLLYFVACITGKAGRTDGIVLAAAGALTGLRFAVALASFGLLFLSVSAILLLTLHRINRNSRLPFLPCLFAAYLLAADILR